MRGQITTQKENEEIAIEPTIKHEQSKIQQYVKSNNKRAAYILPTGQNITEHEIHQAIIKLNNMKSVGDDAITAEIIKANKEWAIPLIQHMYNQSAKNNAMPKAWMKGVTTFIHKEMN